MTQKKFFIILSLLILPLFSFWQDLSADLEWENYDIENNTIENDSIDNNILENNIDENNSIDQINNDDNSNQIDDDNNLQSIWQDNWLWLIWFWFCNEWTDNLSESLSYAVMPNKPFKVCLIFYNNSNQDITINTRIIDKEIADDGSSYCAYDSTNIHTFIDANDLNDIKEITLPSWEYIIKEFNVTYPIWIQWNQSACFSYYIDDWAAVTMLKTIVNKAYTMNFFVWWIDDIKNEISFNDIEANLDDNKDLNLNFVLSNDWNLEDKIEIKGTITNIFWYKKDFTIEWKWIQLTPGTSVPVSAVLWSLPSYGWLYNIEFTATATPFFSYDISNSSIDPTLLESKEFSASTTYFQMPWLIIIIVVIVILLIITIFRKPKEKVVYVQTPQQPTPNNGYNAYQQPQYQVPQQPQVAQPQPQYQQPTQPQYGQPTQDPNNYWQPNQQ